VRAAVKHLLESFSWAGLPLLIGGTQIGRAALPRYFNLGKTVAIVGDQPNTWRKRDEARLFCCLPLMSKWVNTCSSATLRGLTSEQAVSQL
jgi:hypothetical protein